ncbi:hypothetical protein BGX28_007329 [Mortierella sp. GBA30]|nr:hypothetical protein BGX28_007329 [Mortierella sp. GBA30]
MPIRWSEEEHLRSRNAQILQDLEENDLQLELDCSSPPSLSSAWTITSDDDSSLSQEERALQQDDFELELALEIQHQIQKHTLDGTLLNESPSALHRQLEHKLRNQKRLLSAYRASRHQQAVLSYASQECVAWRARKQQLLRLEQKKAITSSFSSYYKGTNTEPAAVTAAAAVTRFQQFHPNRRVDPDSIFSQTLTALGQKKYTDPNGYVVELDPIKVMAGSRRASVYDNDDIHVLVLDMQWDPEVTVVVGNVLDETIKLRQEGYRPVMLNVGNSKVPGGEYHLDSATDNEADLFRRTTLHQCLDQEPRRSRFYPLSDSGGIYCPNQAVFRHGLDKNNEFMDRFEWISVVSVAPIPTLETREKDGGLGGVQFLEGEDDVLRRRILAAMKVGVSQGHDALVLPPHGTEIGQNPSEAIAAIYRSIIGRDFMGGRKRFQTYKKIVMVLDPDQAYKIVNETSSYRPTQPPSSPTDATTTPLPVSEEEDSVEYKDHEGDDHWDSSSLHDDIDVKDGHVEEDDDHQRDQVVLQQRQLTDTDADGHVPERSHSKSNEDKEEEEAEEEEEEFSNGLIDDDDEDDSENNNNESSEDQAESMEDGAVAETVDGETDDGDEELVDQLVPEDEVSESEALLEEQRFLEDEPDQTDEALDKDLNDSPQSQAADSNINEDALSDDRDAEEEDEENTTEAESEDVESSEDNAEEDGSEQHSYDQEEEPKEFVLITETVREVFERMLEQRSLLIVKNRARGLLDTDEQDSGRNTTVVDINPSGVNSTNLATSNSNSTSAVVAPELSAS